MPEQPTPQNQDPPVTDESELSTDELEQASGGSVNNSCTNNNCAANP